jgi:hypothetical protein
MWQYGQAHFGCLPFGSLLTELWRQSATRHRLAGRLSFGSLRINVAHHRSSRHRQVGCPSFGGQRNSLVIHSCRRLRQNLWQFEQKGVALCKGQASLNTAPLVGMHRPLLLAPA